MERLAYRRHEAADLIGVSTDYFDDRVLPALKVIREGRLILIPATELRKWVEQSSALTLER